MCDSMSKWIKCSDRLPILGQDLLFCSNGKKFIPTTYGFFGGNHPARLIFLGCDNRTYTNEVTHWMKLPEAHKDE